MMIECKVYLVDDDAIHAVYGFTEQLLALFADRVEHDNATRQEVLADTLNHLLQMTAMPTDKHGIRTGKVIEVCTEEVADMTVDARSAELPAVEFHKFPTLCTHLERFYLKMRELQTCFDTDTAGTEAYIP